GLDAVGEVQQLCQAVVPARDRAVAGDPAGRVSAGRELLDARHLDAAGKLAPADVAPARDRAVREQRAAVRLAAGDRGGRRHPGDLLRLLAVVGAAAAELPRV